MFERPATRDGVRWSEGVLPKSSPIFGLEAAAVTTDLPSIIFNGGPMLNSFLDGELAGAGTIIWEARRRLAAGQIDHQKFNELLSGSAPSAGHCNVMGTALSKNSLAEALDMAVVNHLGKVAITQNHIQIPKFK